MMSYGYSCLLMALVWILCRPASGSFGRVTVAGLRRRLTSNFDLQLTVADSILQGAERASLFRTARPPVRAGVHMNASEMLSMIRPRVLVDHVKNTVGEAPLATIVVPENADGGIMIEELQDNLAMQRTAPTTVPPVAFDMIVDGGGHEEETENMLAKSSTLFFRVVHGNLSKKKYLRSSPAHGKFHPSAMSIMLYPHEGRRSLWRERKEVMVSMASSGCPFVLNLDAVPLLTLESKMYKWEHDPEYKPKVAMSAHLPVVAESLLQSLLDMNAMPDTPVWHQIDDQKTSVEDSFLFFLVLGQRNTRKQGDGSSGDITIARLDCLLW